jgi:hypothetical protein
MILSDTLKKAHRADILVEKGNPYSIKGRSPDIFFEKDFYQDLIPGGTNQIVLIGIS